MTVHSADAVRFEWTGDGVIDVVAGPASDGYQLPPARLDGQTVDYTIELPDADPIQREVGYGVWTDATSTLTRGTVTFSTNANAKVVFLAGTKIVRIVWTERLAEFMNRGGFVPNATQNNIGTPVDDSTEAYLNEVDTVLGTIPSVPIDGQTDILAGTVTSGRLWRGYATEGASPIVTITPDEQVLTHEIASVGVTQVRLNEPAARRPFVIVNNIGTAFEIVRNSDGGSIKASVPAKHYVNVSFVSASVWQAGEAIPIEGHLADSVVYDPAGSSLTSTDVQAALDEAAGLIENVGTAAAGLGLPVTTGTDLTSLELGQNISRTALGKVTVWENWAQTTVADYPDYLPGTRQVQVGLDTTGHLDGSAVFTSASEILVGVSFNGSLGATGILVDATDAATSLTGFALTFNSSALEISANGNTVSLTSAADGTPHSVAFTLNRGTGQLNYVSDIVGFESGSATWGALPNWTGESFKTLGDPGTAGNTGTVAVGGLEVRAHTSFAGTELPDMLRWMQGMNR